MRLTRCTAMLLAVALHGGCATAQQPPGSTPAVAAPRSKADPWEGFNRQVFAFNEGFDRVLLRPVVQGYQAVLPELVRTGIGNVFDNVRDAWSAANHLLQGNPVRTVEMSARFMVNTTLGLGGMLDWASEMGIERNREDFGQTLGTWGVPMGPFLMLPVVGASSVRDGVGFIVDREASLGNLFTDRKYVNWITTLELVQVRSELLPATRLIDSIALDKYSFVRDAYLARRRNLVFDGDPPPREPTPEGATAPK